MQPRTSFAVLFLVALPLPPCGATNMMEQTDHTSFRLLGKGVVKTLEFKQPLLICNAYPSESPMTVTKNEKEALADADNAIAFRECRYMSSRVVPKDELDLALRDTAFSGTFQFSELPTTDAVLLLVVEKHGKSAKISFRSFVFPMSSDGNAAQLVVIDTSGSNSTTPRVEVKGHTTGKEVATVSKHAEQLNFNRMYAIEEGTYDISIVDRTHDVVGGHGTKTAVRMLRSQNYVILRTGDATKFGDSLVVFPQSPQSYSSSLALSVATVVVVVLGMVV